ncbi:serum paraoxonase/arylesterase family protein [Nemania abortiva]|nr:serum paraoxonase/arylesterase family protein [Nemania abortiva]
MAVFLYFIATLFGALGAWLYPSARHFAAVLGIRPFESSVNIHGVETHFIPDTAACEDLEYHAPSGMLYTACTGDLALTRGWMPGANSLERPDQPGYGTLVVINPTTLKSQKLSLVNFKGPFATHGIALYTAPSKPNLVYIYAVNHLPNPRWTPGSTTEPKAASQIELFVHTVGSSTAKHVRSIAHPLIRTPNDLLAISENEFLVTNDHHYREGPLRLLEEMFRLWSWTDLVHVRFDDARVDAAVALNSIPTNNGLGWGPDQQVVIGDAVGGYVHFASLPDAENRTMTVSHSVPVDCVVDNAAFFADPYAGVDGKDYSGYLMPGVANALNFHDNFKDMTLKAPLTGRVYYLPAVVGRDKSIDGKKLSKLIFRDDGQTVRSITTAIIVAIDPATNGGKREGWLFVTSVIGASTIATKIDFEKVLV